VEDLDHVNWPLVAQDDTLQGRIFKLFDFYIHILFTSSVIMNDPPYNIYISLASCNV
jgi:hypothetical protein